LARILEKQNSLQMSQVFLYPHINHWVVLLFKDSISGTTEPSPQIPHAICIHTLIAGWIALKQTLRICLRACFKINELKQTVAKLFSPKSSGIFRRSRRILLPEPASLTNP
jgi:hypothetical protein